jgi:8-oxo-dGTP pyrophosphatase MutT (NUDIX family)
MDVDYYVAAGGVIVRGHEVLLLHKHRLDEYVLPKGHVDPGETVEQAALREAREETGFANLRVLAQLGQAVRSEFSLNGRWTVRDETYFLMALADETRDTAATHDHAEYDRQAFHQLWVPLAEAPDRLTFEPARTFVRRAAEWLGAQP